MNQRVGALVRESADTPTTTSSGRLVLRVLLVLVLVTVGAAACSSDARNDRAQTGSTPGSMTSGDGHPKAEPATGPTPTFTVSPGVEQITVTRAEPHARLTLLDPQDAKLITLVADDEGQAVFAYIPTDYRTFETGAGRPAPIGEGQALRPGGGYRIRDDSAARPGDSERFTVLARDDHPPTSLYDAQQLRGVHWSIQQSGAVQGERSADGLGYVLTRDGTQLSAMVRLPDPAFYGNGPYPTVVEYSGYDPSDPDNPQPGTMLANAMGFATVGVNMRGTGCSGGVFDVFNPAQQADGYDVIETVARQPWVLHNKVGMIGLSYSGISQLYVAATRPPSLSAITPLSVIEDPWKMSWPGGIYNAGFTKQWLEARDREAKANGQSWVTKRVDGGDQICKVGQQLRDQNVDFENFARSLRFRPDDDDQRDLSLLVKDITVPVYLSGAWQDEQTGSRFATMLGNFTGTDQKHFVLYNGHHADGYAPANISRWVEFLQLYVEQQVPHMLPVVRGAAVASFKQAFGVDGLTFEPDRFRDLVGRYDQALARWEADPVVRVRMEWGNGRPDAPGAPVARYDVTFDSWPPKAVAPLPLYFGSNGALSYFPPTGDAGSDRFQFDPGAGAVTYTSGDPASFQQPVVATHWQDTPDGKGVSYLTDPLTHDVVLAGAGYADLWLRSDADDADLEVVLSEVEPDGTEVRIQNGVLRAGDRKLDESRSSGLVVQPTYRERDYQKLPAGEAVEVKVPIFPVMHAIRTGSRLRVQVNTPGRDLPLWSFENDDRGKPDAWHHIVRSAEQASGVVLPMLPPGTIDVPAGYPPCPSLRGQPCRPYHPLSNLTD